MPIRLEILATDLTDLLISQLSLNPLSVSRIFVYVAHIYKFLVYEYSKVRFESRNHLRFASVLSFQIPIDHYCCHQNRLGFQCH